MILKNPSSSKFFLGKEKEEKQNEKSAQLFGKISDVA